MRRLPTTRGILAAALLATTLLVLVTPSGGAEEAAVAVVPARAELDALLADARELEMGSIGTSNVVRALELSSLAQLQEEHIEHSVGLSWALPGLGHYVNGETGTAIAFLATDAVVGVATLVLGSLLLPQAVRGENLNYLQSTLGEIETRWKSVTIGELVPSLTVVLTGSLLGLSVRAFAARDAAGAAMRAIRDETVRFEPEPLRTVR
jgi:hypothetical protein